MKKENIEDIVALGPMQQSFLWHSLQVDAASSVLQLRCTFRGNISIDQLKLAWAMVVHKHQALRSSVHWESVKKPIQLIHKHVVSDISLIKPSSTSDNDDVLPQFLERDRREKLDLTDAPAYRITLCQTQDNTYELVWTLSHVLLDGWSCAVVISDWVNIYSGLMLETEIPTTSGPSLSEYRRWIVSQDKQAMLDFWDDYLPSHIQLCATNFQPPETTANDSTQPDSCQAVLSQEDFGKLQQNIRQAGLSLGTLLQAAFATVLHARSSKLPVVIGTTVSGRQIDLPQTDLRVGMLINLIPVCIDFDSSMSIHEWLTSLQSGFFSALPYAHASMTDVLSLRPEQSALYDCLLVLENQPSVVSTAELEVSNFHSGIISEFAMTLIAVPGPDLQLDIRYSKDVFKHADMELMLRQCKDLLLNLPSCLSEPVSWLDQYKRIDSTAGTDLPICDMETGTEAPASAEPDELVKPVIEQKLREMWSGILKSKHISVRDDFFDLGGTSLQAMMLFDQIEKNLDIRLAPTTLFQAPTISDIATLIENNQPDSAWSNIVGISTSGTKIPIFIPFEQADMLSYGPLCTELGPDQPVYGLKVPVNALPTDELIETLVRHIKTLQPIGPYQLAGLSGAGMLAWRIAQKLQAQGNVVAMLALLDSYGPAYPRLLPPFARLKQVSIYVLREFALKAKRAISRLTAKLLSPVSSVNGLRQVKQDQPTFNEQQHSAFMQRVAKEHALAPQFLREVSRKQPFINHLVNRIQLALIRWRFHSNNLRIAYIMFIQGLLLESGTDMQQLPDDSDNHENDPLPLLKSVSGCLHEDMPATSIKLKRYLTVYDGLQQYDGHLVFFRATQRAPGIVNDPLAGWQFLFPKDARVHVIPGSHSSMLKQPNVSILAKYVEQEVAHQTKMQV